MRISIWQNYIIQMLVCHNIKGWKQVGHTCSSPVTRFGTHCSLMLFYLACFLTLFFVLFYVVACNNHLFSFFSCCICACLSSSFYLCGNMTWRCAFLPPFFIIFNDLKICLPEKHIHFHCLVTWNFLFSKYSCSIYFLHRWIQFLILICIILLTRPSNFICGLQISK